MRPSSSHTDEQIKLTFLHDVFSGKRTDVPRRGHSRLPVQFAVRYRVANTSSFVDSAISEIGVGGALLTTTEPLPIETELTLEVVAARCGRADRDRGPRLVSRAVGRLGSALC